MIVPFIDAKLEKKFLSIARNIRVFFKKKNEVLNDHPFRFLSTLRMISATLKELA